MSAKASSTRLTGKVGRGAIGTFVAEDSITTILIPGSQSSALELLDEERVL